jgi:hypothetical protein
MFLWLAALIVFRGLRGVPGTPRVLDTWMDTCCAAHRRTWQACIGCDIELDQAVIASSNQAVLELHARAQRGPGRASRRLTEPRRGRVPNMGFGDGIESRSRERGPEAKSKGGRPVRAEPAAPFRFQSVLGSSVPHFDPPDDNASITLSREKLAGFCRGG